MSRRHRNRRHPGGFDAGFEAHDWRDDRDASPVILNGLAALDDEPDLELSRQIAINNALSEHLDKTTSRAELAEYALTGLAPAWRVRLYVALSLISGVLAGYIVRLFTA